MVGRKDYLISTGGENVNPAEVESVLLQHPGISEAIVFPIRDSKWGEIVAAAIVQKDKTSNLTFENVREFLEGKVSIFKIPKKIFFENEFPKPQLRKVERDKLIKNYML